MGTTITVGYVFPRRVDASVLWDDDIVENSLSYHITEKQAHISWFSSKSVHGENENIADI